ncbi:MAG: 3-ketoacyl-ACP reductase [Paenibacillus sp.]|jgi:3-oxoacyl-[acyl-carrier protein] reductase|nr:3-ketoacyl-ACP reductase [Paenibacillus sp.]
MSNKFDGKVVLVTGASRGIGRVIAEEFAGNGAKVVVNYPYDSNAGEAEEVIVGIRKNGGEAKAIQADISRVAEVELLFQKTIETYGQIHILVNNAGIMITKPILNITEEDFDKQFSINVKGTYFACQQAAKHMKAHGRIINLSSSVTGVMFPAYSIYAGTKGAVDQFTRQLSKELGPKGITINAVAPGAVNTELFNNGKTEEQIEAIINMNSFGRLPEPNDITGAILFLASDEAAWVTGQSIRVNGGFI